MRSGFKVSHGPKPHEPTGAMIFEEAKDEKDARRLLREYVKNTYGHTPDGFKHICSVVPLAEISTPSF